MYHAINCGIMQIEFWSVSLRFTRFPYELAKAIKAQPTCVQIELGSTSNLTRDEVCCCWDSKSPQSVLYFRIWN